MHLGEEKILCLCFLLKGTLHQSGTFNGHPIAMAAGLATLTEMTPDVYQRINLLGDLLRHGLNNIFSELEMKVRTTGVGSLSFINYTLDEIKNYQDARKAAERARELIELVHLCFLTHGIFFAGRGQFAISTPMTKNDISQTVESIKESFLELRPAIEKVFPYLVKK